MFAVLWSAGMGLGFCGGAFETCPRLAISTWFAALVSTAWLEYRNV
jgi:hypothetical protein